MSEHPLARLGWRADRAVPDGHAPARVVAIDRGRAVVDTGSARWSAPLAGRLHSPPVVGDFVAVPGEDGPVRAVLPRRGVIARRVDRGRPQVLAANVDLALIATSLNRDLNPRRIARFIAVTARGEVEALVLLTKADLAEEVPDLGLDALAVSVLDGTGMPELRARLEPGHTAVLLGTSGVGKSTLVNALLGDERQATQAIRAGDDRGRHTTVRREMFGLPGGALLIDTPGLRTVAPLADGDEPAHEVVDKAALQRVRKQRGRAGSKALRRFYEERGR